MRQTPEQIRAGLMFSVTLVLACLVDCMATVYLFLYRGWHLLAALFVPAVFATIAVLITVPKDSP